MSGRAASSEKEPSPEEVIARATAARGDIFPEWKILAYAAPQTYDLVTRTGGYFHKYEGQSSAEQQPLVPSHASSLPPGREKQPAVG